MEKILITPETSKTEVLSLNLSQNEITEITNYINKYRAIHMSPPLIWDTNISTFSQSWATYLLNNNLFKHSGTNQYGENLAYFVGYGTDTITLLKYSVDSWYDEISLYNFNNPGFTEQSGHFTALVWKSCTKFGMGFAVNQSTGTVIVSYNCSPPSNVIGQFSQNVLPPNSLPIPIPPPLPPVTINPLCTKTGLIDYLTQIKIIVSRGATQKTIINQINYLIFQLLVCPNF